MQTLEQIAATVAGQARRIGAPDHLLPGYGAASDDGAPFVAVDAEQYHYVVEERGQESSRQSSRELSDLLYWIAADITHQLGSAHEMANRAAGKDFRRGYFAKQLALLEKIDPAMALRRKQEIEGILQDAPFADHVEP